MRLIKGVSASINPCDNSGFILAISAQVIDHEKPEEGSAADMASAIQQQLSGNRQKVKEVERLIYCKSIREIGDKVSEVMSEIDLVSRGIDI